MILRPPMIYGPGCKGNYPVLSLMARRLHFFPQVDNQRSMLFVGNLMAFVKLMIDNNESGTFFPQNAQYSNTSALVALIAAAHGRKIRLVRGFTWALKLLGVFTPLVNKAFGDLSYDMEMSGYPRGEYRLFSLGRSIRITEGRAMTDTPQKKKAYSGRQPVFLPGGVQNKRHVRRVGPARV